MRSVRSGRVRRTTLVPCALVVTGTVLIVGLFHGCTMEEPDPQGDAGTTALDILGADAAQAEGRLFVTPTNLDFGRVAAGESEERQVILQNTGTAPLTIDNVIVISESGEFTAVVEDLHQFPLTIVAEGDDEARVRVRYSSADDGFASATMFVFSNDPSSPKARVGLEVNGAMPCISVNGDVGIDFGERRVDRSHTRVVSVTNCSDPSSGETLVVDAIEFADSASTIDGPFRLEFSGEFLPLELAPGRSDEFAIVFEPTVEGEEESAALEIRSNDSVRPQVEIEVRGVGSDNSCPTVVAQCSVRDSGAEPSSELNVRNLETLDCTATGADADGEIVEYNWEVVERPAGSTSIFNDPANGESSFFVDLVGRYVLELDAIDDMGAEACERAQVVVVASSERDILVQLSWTTPNDGNEADTGFGVGADVDLHLLHPDGCWEDATFDAHWRNTNPNWGNPRQTDDDPSIDIDDTDGAGPENVSLSNPEAGLAYGVGVHYWNDHGFGASVATLRVFLFGSMVFEQEKSLEAQDAFWHAVNIQWPSGALDIVDDFYGSIEDAPCP